MYPCSTNQPPCLFKIILFVLFFIVSFPLLFLLCCFSWILSVCPRVKAGRGTRIRTGVQGSEAPDAIRYTIPPCCFTSDSGCTNVRRMCSFAAQAQISRTNCDDRGPASTNLVHQILVPSCISPVRIEYSNVGITDKSFGYLTVFRKIRYVVCARKPTYPRTCACHT